MLIKKNAGDYIMKICIKIVLTVLCVVFVALFVKISFNSLFIGGNFFVPLNYESSEEIFENKKEELYIVNQYFSELRYNCIYIPASMDKEIMSADGSDVMIENSEVIQAIKNLKENGCTVIGKENNTIYFQMWSNLDSGNGFAYTIDGTKPTLQFLTKTKKMNEDNWYYYEEDFNEWKLKNE